MDQKQKDDLLGDWCIGVAIFCAIGLLIKLAMEAWQWLAS